MSANERHIEEARNLVDEWLSEQEGYAIRAERMPEGSRDWLIAACSIGLAAAHSRGRQEGMKDGFLAGFNASGEGWNGEYPFGDRGISPETDEHFIKARSFALSALDTDTEAK